MLTNKRILLIIGGGIAAFKSLDLIRRLRERGANVTVCMTTAAMQFVTPLSAASLSGNQVYSDLFSLTDEAAMGHIQLSRAADLLVVAPATADLMSKMANGIANDLASTLLLATDKKTLVAPAMNVRMWTHPATARNVTQLRKDGVLFVGPDDGEMACGEYGPGRMAEPLEIVDAVEAALFPQISEQFLTGKRVVITSGPTHEPIDPVRYIANRSSGRQGHALATAAKDAGAEVILISGPVNIPDPAGLETIKVETAEQMQAAVEAALPADVFISAAAVADWRVDIQASQKVKKSCDGPPALVLVENPDILATVASRTFERPRLVIGFAAETEKVIEYGQAKLVRKCCDMIVANDVSPGSGVMGGLENSVHLITASAVESLPQQSKGAVAIAIIERCGAMLEERRS
ncbi:MAG: bifunctional phosphopantothenoylcysteine decarboxylase/phosphopantothenate--cysteine ligase CoaBC [Beijerinckiaceae bacterium]|nr:bifunctional phosphopantothenoylcysteine decarboxylase/phosphopantothenate--cysteine ligase CoaBC [Beijerinckiaceae bacterium]